jgi:hypothetical protein
MDHGLSSMVICRSYSGVCRGVLGMDIMSEKYMLIRELRLVNMPESRRAGTGIGFANPSCICRSWRNQNYGYV